MSEEILKVFLDDLRTIRVVCQHCKTTVELNISEIKNRIIMKCPLCPQHFALNANDKDYAFDYNVFVELQRVFTYLEKIETNVKVEFPVKIGSSDSK